MKNDELFKVEEKLSDILKRCSLDPFVSVDNIKKWITDIDHEDKMTPIKMLTGLLDKEKMVDADLFQDLINTMIKLNHLLPLKDLEGKTCSDVLKKRKKQGEPTKVYTTQTTLPPMEWSDHYYNAMKYSEKQNFLKASQEFDKTFEKLLESNTTDSDIYRVFCNAGLAYLLSGKAFLGAKCFEIAQKLNPKYSFASEQMKRYIRGDFNPFIELGFFANMKNNVDEWKRTPAYLDLAKVMKWPEKKIIKKLSEFGVTVDKQEFIKTSKTVNNPERLAEKIFYPQTNIEGIDKDFIWIAACSLWNIYCPNEESISGFNDLLHDALLFVSDFDAKNKRSKKIQEIYEKECNDYFKKAKKYIFCEKKGFLQEWQKTIDFQTDATCDLNTFLISLLYNPKFEKDVLKVVAHLKKQIPHPDWTVVEIINNIINNNSHGEELYKELKRNHPFYCYVACDIAQYYMQKNDYLSAEFYLKEALDIVDNRAKKNKLSIDIIETTIYDDYINVFDIFEELFYESNANSNKKKLLKAKILEVEKKYDIYSKSPKNDQMNEAMTEILAKLEIREAENSNASKYYNYLTQFGINFETKNLIKVDEHRIRLIPEKYLASDNLEKKQWSKKTTGEKIGRNEPCPCGSGKKYKKCCGAKLKK